MAGGGGGKPTARASSTSKASGGGGKPGGKKGGGGGNNDDVRRETPLQAIVFADSFTETFRPISLDMPKVLLPLANVPMLEYSLEFLVSGGVQEVILFCTGHIDQIDHFIKHESQVAKRVSVQCVYSATSVTAGDALREIDRQQLIQSDPFILMSGDVVANVNLQQIIREHQQRKKKDANCIMTSVFKEIPPQALSTNIRPLGDELIVGIDNLTSQIVLYEDDPAKSATHLATVFLDEHAQITLRSDLMDCFIDICSPEVLLKFAEDFDYQDLRRDFFHNEVQNYELGKKFFVKIVTDEFAARVMDPRTYSGISRAILQRWVFPMVPDNNYLGAHSTNYTYHRGMIYTDEQVTLARSCRVERESIVAAGSRFGEHTTVSKSAIGRNCRIGENVRITGSFLWENVTIGDNVTITNAILCDNVVVQAGAVVDEGCVLSFGVVIGAGFHLKAFSKVTTAGKIKRDDGFSSDEEEEEEEEETTAVAKTGRSASVADGEWNPKHVGVGGVGRLWTLDDDGIELDSDDEEDEEENEEDADGGVDDTDEDEEAIRQARRLAKLKLTMMGAADVVAEQARKWEEWETLSSSVVGSDVSDDGDLHDESEDDKIARFQRIIREMVSSGDAAGNEPDDCFMEIKSFKFAQNRTFAQVIQGIVPGMLDRIATDGQGAMAILAQTRAKCQKWSSVLKRCLVEDGDQASVITAVENYVLSEEKQLVWKPLFRFVLQIVYDLEWVSEDVVLEWHALRVDAEDGETAPATQLAMSKEVLEFVEWLQEEEEDDDDDDDSEEEDSDEE